MEYSVCGWPEDEPTLRLDYRRFSYAGKFVTGSYGIAVVRGETPIEHRSPGAASDPTDIPESAELPDLPDGLSESDFVEGILAAVAFNADRTDAETLWLRYLTVRRDLRGSGRQLGPRLAAFTIARAARKGYTTARIAVNNVFSYQALYKAGFSYTGRQTGLAELILDRPIDSPTDRPIDEPAAAPTAMYQQGLDEFREREGLSDAERSYLAAREGADPPEPVAFPAGGDERADSGGSKPRRSSE